MNKNRGFAHKLMSRDFLSREEAEKIVYRKHFENLELEEYEKELLDEGDSLIPAEAGDDVKGGMMMWED